MEPDRRPAGTHLGCWWKWKVHRCHAGCCGFHQRTPVLPRHTHPKEDHWAKKVCWKKKPNRDCLPSPCWQRSMPWWEAFGYRRHPYCPLRRWPLRLWWWVPDHPSIQAGRKAASGPDPAYHPIPAAEVPHQRRYRGASRQSCWAADRLEGLPGNGGAR